MGKELKRHDGIPTGGTAIPGSEAHGKTLRLSKSDRPFPRGDIPSPVCQSYRQPVLPLLENGFPHAALQQPEFRIVTEKAPSPVDLHPVSGYARQIIRYPEAQISFFGLAPINNRGRHRVPHHHIRPQHSDGRAHALGRPRGGESRQTSFPLVQTDDRPGREIPPRLQSSRTQQRARLRRHLKSLGHPHGIQGQGHQLFLNRQRLRQNIVIYIYKV